MKNHTITSRGYTTDKLLDSVMRISKNPQYSEIFDRLSGAESVEATFTVLASEKEGATVDEINAILVATFLF